MRSSNELKKYFARLVKYTSPFVLLFTIFVCTYYRYYSISSIQTDLTNLGMRMDDQSYFYSFDTLSVNYLFARYEYADNIKQNDSTTVWVFGDSFTQKGGSRIYSNYIAGNMPDKKVCLIKFSPGGPYSPVEQFVQIAYKEKLPPYVIVSLVERSLIDRMLKLDFSENDSLFTLMSNYKRPPYSRKKITDMAVEYYKKLLNIDNPVLSTDLTIDAFSYPGEESKLLFLNEDILIRFSEREMDKAISMIDTLFQFAKNKGTKLLFLVCPDKFDMYQDYLVNDSKYYNEKENTLNYVSKRVKNFSFIEAKSILKPYIDQGVKDIYYFNDTHWSPKASKIVADTLCFYLY